jgi:septum formation protein
VIGSDTVVVIDDVVLGKPVDLDEARRMLHRLRGRTHRVLTAVAVLAPDLPEEVWCETAEVRMRAATDAEIEAYLRTGESMDKAGAYAFQGDGGRLVAGVDGDCFVVIGLPLRSVADTLRRIGLSVSVDLDRLYEQSTDLLAR